MEEGPVEELDEDKDKDDEVQDEDTRQNERGETEGQPVIESPEANETTDESNKDQNSGE